MTLYEKKKKAAIVAVTYYLSKEAVAKNENAVNNIWGDAAKQNNMENRLRVQRRGRSLPIR